MEHKEEKKNCQNCKKDFTILSEDFSFYEKIKVPAPTFCPECRSRRRLLFRNERSLYRRKCDVTGKDIISIYSSDVKNKVCDKDYWYTDKFDALSYGIDIDWNKPFFEQFYELSLKVPLPSLRVEISENCEYNNDMSESKDCYLCARTHRCQRMIYTYRGNSSSDCGDCFQVVDKSEFLYESIECITCSRSQYLYFCNQCVDSYFLYNCQNCMNCFMCSNLRNKQYCIMNEQYTREEYLNTMKEIDLGDRGTREELISRFKDLILAVPRKYLSMLNAVKCTGDNIVDSNNCKDCYGIKGCENSKYILDIMHYKDSMDSYSGGKGSDLIYESTSVAACSRTSFCLRATHSHDVYYSWFVSASSNIFGCIGLKHKDYCILNKQYTKEEYNTLVGKIIKQMTDSPFIDKSGFKYGYGEFFPESFSPFAYNETTAEEYYPLNKDEVIKNGYKFKDPEEKNYVATVTPSDLPSSIKDVEESILKEIISCKHRGDCSHQCTTAFRITSNELEFYKRMNIPIPDKCPNCRHYNRLEFRNPIKLWHRECMCDKTNHFHGIDKCTTDFDTSYSPNRKEIVYCDKCYKLEMY
ncbi:hypothetical protein HXX01_00895 [Candidatus Nomurabacteria bacterium]|nr:hypothetical protein [Candidatus Nomurabacteria bacterium]